MTAPDVNYERMPEGMLMDETDINLRAYFSRMTDDQLRQYQFSWTDDEVMQWDGNFTVEENLFLTCSERDVDIEEYRRVLEEHKRFRGL